SAAAAADPRGHRALRAPPVGPRRGGSSRRQGARDTMRSMADDSRDPEGILAQKHEEFIRTFFKRGAEFAEELLRGNEKLRFRVLELEAQQRASAAGVGPTEVLRELLARIDLLEKEREVLIQTRARVVQENSDWQARYLEVERENSNLANL